MRLVLHSLIVAILVSLAPLASPKAEARADEFPLYGHVDYPATGSTIQTGALYVAGWAFDCRTGVHPAGINVAFFNLDTSQWYAPDFVIYRDLPRMDVYNTFRATCPSVSPGTGYHLYFPPPWPGRWRMWVVWADEPFGLHLNQAIDLTVVP